MINMGIAHKYGDNIDTDVILPGRYLVLTDYHEMASHCLEDLDPQFVHSVQDGDILVAGHNFGCGSSREHAPISIRYSGIKCIIAKSFARIFYRNAINTGLPVITCSEAVDVIVSGDLVSVDFEKGKISIPDKNASFPFMPFSGFFQGILEAEGLINYFSNVNNNKKLQEVDDVKGKEIEGTVE